MNNKRNEYKILVVVEVQKDVKVKNAMIVYKMQHRAALFV